ncbi:MAG TPA: hypothetical protein VIH93_12905 [Thermoanaerobaculia bacterium]
MRPSPVSRVLAGCLLLALAAAAPAAAGCTATLNCNNSCFIFSYACPAPSSCILSCFAASQTLNCSGNSVCSVGASSVTCDGVQQSCATGPRCSAQGFEAHCGTVTKVCQFPPHPCSF